MHRGNGTTKIRRIHPAFAQPEISFRRKISANTAMKIQIAMTQKDRIWTTIRSRRSAAAEDG